MRIFSLTRILEIHQGVHESLSKALTPGPVSLWCQFVETKQ